MIIHFGAIFNPQDSKNNRRFSNCIDPSLVPELVVHTSDMSQLVIQHFCKRLRFTDMFYGNLRYQHFLTGGNEFVSHFFHALLCAASFILPPLKLRTRLMIMFQILKI